MPTFNYTGIHQNGEEVSGDIVASQREEALKSLMQQNIIVTALYEDQNLDHPRVRQRTKKIKLDDLVILSRQLATMVNAGLPLFQTLDILKIKLSTPHYNKY